MRASRRGAGSRTGRRHTSASSLAGMGGCGPVGVVNRVGDFPTSAAALQNDHVLAALFACGRLSRTWGHREKRCADEKAHVAGDAAFGAREREGREPAGSEELAVVTLNRSLPPD